MLRLLYFFIITTRWAIVGETEQFMNKRTEEDKYLQAVGQLQNHVSRLNHNNQDDSSLDCIKITTKEEYPLIIIIIILVSLIKITQV